MSTRKPLTNARTAELCAALIKARTRAHAVAGSEHSVSGLSFVSIGVENALLSLVQDLAGTAAADMVSEAMGRDIRPEEVDAYRRERDARQAAYLVAANARVPA